MDGTTTTTSDDAGGELSASDAPTAGQPQLLATAVGDQCANCGARLAGDQRYCVECGERRGKPRYSLSARALSGGAMRTAGAQAASRPPRLPRLSSNGALIGGVATLLLAMAVGLLIGLSVNKAPPARSSSVQYLQVPGSASAPTTSTPSSASTSPSTGAGKSSKSKSKSAAGSIAAAAKLPSAAKKIPQKLQSSVAKVGSKCASGGKFTGTYFGAGASRTGCSK
jgi:hypothetical protein